MNSFYRLASWRRALSLSALTFCQTATDEINSKGVEEPVVVELKQNATDQLTHKYLFQQTCTVSVNASCQMITIALVTLSDASQKYKNELVKIMDIMENNKWTHGDLEDLLIEYRYNITEAKTFYLDSISAMDSALKLGQSSGLMSFTVGANTVFNIMSNMLYSAEKEFQCCIEDIRKVEDKFNKLLADTMKKIEK